MNDVKLLLVVILILNLASTTFSGLNYFQQKQTVNAASTAATTDKLRVSSYNAPLAQPADTSAETPVDVAQAPANPLDPSQDELQPGDDAPLFTMQDMSGKWVSLAQFKNLKNVVVMAWLQTCPHCLEFLPRFNKFASQVKGNKKIQILTVTRAIQPDDEDKLRAFLKSKNYMFPVLLSSDKDSQFGRDYKLRGVPTVWVIDKNLKVKGLFRGDRELEGDLKSRLLKPLGM